MSEECLLLSEDMSKSTSDGAGTRITRSPTDPEDHFIEEIQTSNNPDISQLADRSQGNTNLGSGGGDLDVNDIQDIQNIGSGQYEDFHTIDWQRDLARDRLRHKFIVKRRTGLLGTLKAVIDASSGWLCVLIVGIVAGAIAGVIDIGTRWLSDLKDGVCHEKFYLDKEQCCWSSSDVRVALDGCNAWQEWPNLFNLYDENGAYKVVGCIFYVLWAFIFGTLCVMLVKVFAPYACGSGIPEIKCILSGFIIRGYLGKWTFVIKSVGLMLAAASGLCLGKEGPMVHLACCVGNIFSYLFPKYGKNEAKKREILSASAAAGVSVAFGAPIGGVLFSLEEASYYFPLKTLWRSFFCALIAGLILKFVNPFGSEQTSMFHIDYTMKWSYIELIPFSILGILGGVIGALFIRLNIWWCKLRKTNARFGRNPIAEVIFVTSLCALISYWNKFTQISMSELLKILFDRCGPEDTFELCQYNRTIKSATQDSYDRGSLTVGIRDAILYLLIALIFKFVFTIFTFGMKVPAGLFVPSMAVGAIIGRICGILMEQLALSSSSDNIWNLHCKTGKECVMPGLYAMVGAAAVLGGVTRMTVSLVVIMFELTGSLEFIVPTMAAVMFAKWVGDGLGRDGIYDAHITLNAYPFLDNKEEFPHNTIAAEVMKPKPGEGDARVVTGDTMTVGDMEVLLKETKYNGFPIVTSLQSRDLLGFVTRRDIQLAIRSAREQQEGIVTNSTVYFTNAAPNMPEVVGNPSPLRLRKLMDMAPMTVSKQTPMETVIDMFRKLGLRQILVTENGKLLGILTKKDVLVFLKKMEMGETDSLPF